MTIKTAVRLIKTKLKGSLSVAIEDGLIAGEGVSVMGGVDFGSEPYLISLGNNVRLSSGVRFITHDGGTWAFRSYYEDMQGIVKFGPIKVGDGTFIGAGSTIMPGITIGSHCVIGAGSVCTKDVPSETVWAGVPARQICTLREYAVRSKTAMPLDFDTNAYNKNKKEYLISYYMKR